jgi:hypothetical protein
MGQVSITGLLLAGFIIGSLGVLNDVTVTQASMVFELAAVGSKTSRRTIFLGAMRVGRDHIASTVYTLVLAYAGSSLPLLLLFSVANRSLGDVLTSENVAIEIARSAIGGIALALSVPLTTAIAAVMAAPHKRESVAVEPPVAVAEREQIVGRGPAAQRIRAPPREPGSAPLARLTRQTDSSPPCDSFLKIIFSACWSSPEFARSASVSLIRCAALLSRADTA